MLRSCIHDGGSTPYFELAARLGCNDVGESEKASRTATLVPGNKVVIDLRLLTEMNGTSRRSLSHHHASEVRFLVECGEQTGILTESIAGLPMNAVLAISEPCGYGFPWTLVKSDKSKST